MGVVVGGREVGGEGGGTTLGHERRAITHNFILLHFFLKISYKKVCIRGFLFVILVFCVKYFFKMWG